MHASYNVAEKAARLIHDGKVHEIVPDVVWSVQGDTGAYLVTIVPEGVPTMPAGHTGFAAPKQSCTCPTGDGYSCSHITAVWVTIVRRREAARDPFAGTGAEEDVR